MFLKKYYHYPAIRKLRTIGRNLGVLRIIRPLFSTHQKSYEEAFHHALRGSINTNDVVWDVGANVGLYTKLFLDWVGNNGIVVAFEPMPQTFSKLEKQVSNAKNAYLNCLALSALPGEAVFSPSSEKDSVTAHITDIKMTSKLPENSVLVKVSTADIVTSEFHMPQPNLVKIDVEGFEEDVLRGGCKTFSNHECRHILIEMHFTRMEERKLGDSASRIVKMLKIWGYKISWIDPSHLHAKR
jgi:FkbM family methyltransferase